MPIQTSTHLSQIRKLGLPSMNNVEGRENLDKAASEATKKSEGPHAGLLDHVSSILVVVGQPPREVICSIQMWHDVFNKIQGNPRLRH
jgi:hypothetical protein